MCYHRDTVFSKLRPKRIVAFCHLSMSLNDININFNSSRSHSEINVLRDCKHVSPFLRWHADLVLTPMPVTREKIISQHVELHFI